MANRIVQVGIDDAPPAPMQHGNPDTGDFRGYEVDLLEEVGRRVGFRLSFRRALWSVIVRELMAGDVDLVCSAATVTKEREREVDFCTPHLRLALAVVKRDGITGDTAIRGLRLGVRRGTTAEAYAKQHGVPKPTQVSESNEKLYTALAAGELDAVIDDSPIANYFSHCVAGLQFAGLLAGTEAAYAIMVRKGNDKMRAEINRALAEMERDGTQQRLLFKWFGDGQAKGELMIARIWHGKTKARDADAYLGYLFKSGIPAYRATAGNKGAWVLRRMDGDTAHFITLSFWESRAAIVAFAGDDIAVAKYYAEDEKYLVELEPTVTHYELFQ